jgi:tripartite-type tricarboxylate transporter receptor subunit TctC
VAHDRRAPVVPDVPTTREADAPYFRVFGGLGLFAGPGTMVELREKISLDVAEVIGDRDVYDRISALGEIPRSASPRGLAGLLVEQAKWYSDMAAANGIRSQP